MPRITDLTGEYRGMLFGMLLSSLLAAPSGLGATAVPTLEEVAASKQDLWGEAALCQPDGPSYEFFQSLIPPLHYVNADFRHYPIVLSAPNALVKARLVSNGSALNARANTRAWNEPGTSVLFRVGNDELAFGEYLQRLEGPKWLDGFLPLVELTYHHGSGDYAQETFASVDPLYVTNGLVLSRFTFNSASNEQGDKGRLVIRFEAEQSIKTESGRLLNSKGEVLLWHDGNWKWDANRRLLEASLTNTSSAAVAVATVPAMPTTASPFESGGFGHQRQRCLNAWRTLLGQGVDLVVPEPYVNNAWRALVLANFSLIKGDSMHYSAGNQYDKLYEQEGSQAAQALMLYGYEADMRRLMVPLLDFTRKGLEFHQAGFKLEDVSRYYWQTRDAETVRTLRPRWQPEVDRLASHRSPDNGLFPREQYCGDIATPVFSLNSNAKGWRALRDTAALLEALDDPAEAQRLRRLASDFRRDILRAVDKSLRPDQDPPFVPVALLGEEQPYEVITASKMGSYWNLMANNILGTEIFGQGSRLETGMLRYFQQHGGLAMGLTRSRPWPSFWISSANLNPLYGWYYVRTLLRRDEPDRALVSFYGMLAAGLTPNTFICGEGCALQPVDQWGRQFYCPPNSAGNAFWLQTLRSLLVQDWDLNEDGEPETLRLLFATPKRWLQDGHTLRLQRAPTAFGPVSLELESHLSQGQVVVHLELPNRNAPRQTLLRARVPDGWQVTSAKAGKVALKVDERGTADISALTGKQTVVFSTRKVEPLSR